MAEKTKEQLAVEQYFADMKTVMDTAAGRRFLWQILSRTGMYQSSFTGNSLTFFREGMRNVGLRLTQDLMQERELFMKMWTENASREDLHALDEGGKPLPVHFTGKDDWLDD